MIKCKYLRINNINNNSTIKYFGGTKMKIKKISTAVVEIPTIRAHELSCVTLNAISYVVVRIETDNGIEGLGEAAVLGGPTWSEESIESVKAMIDKYLGPMMIGENPEQLEKLRMKMEMYRDNNFAKAAIEMALFDIVGKYRGVPVYDLLGGLVYKEVPLSWTLAIGDAEKEIREAEEMIKSSNHFIFKLKTGALSLEKDVERVKLVRSAFDKNIKLRVDANQGWDRMTGIKAARALEEYELDFLEQPVPRWDIDGMAAIAKSTCTPIMADESSSYVSDCIQLIKKEAASVYGMKLAKSGGFLGSKRIAGTIESAGYKGYVGCMIETGIGTSAYLHFAASTPAITMGCELFGPMLNVDDIIKEETEYKDGHIIVNDRPGLGVTIDEKKFKKYMIGDVTTIQ